MRLIIDGYYFVSWEGADIGGGLKIIIAILIKVADHYDHP
jgi:hypothetical protein